MEIICLFYQGGIIMSSLVAIVVVLGIAGASFAGMVHAFHQA